MKVVVADTSPLNYLVLIGEVDLLQVAERGETALEYVAPTMPH